MAMPRCVFPSPVGPQRMTQRPSWKSSGPRYAPSRARWIEVWNVKSKSSMVARNGKPARRAGRAVRGGGRGGPLFAEAAGEEVGVAPALVLGAAREGVVAAAHRGQVEPAQEPVEIDGGRSEEHTSELQSQFPLVFP